MPGRSHDDDRPGDPTKSADGKKGKSVFVVPSFLGGKNQMPMAYSNNTHLFYVPLNAWGMDIHNEPNAYKTGAAYLGAGFTIHTIFPDHIGAPEGDRSREQRGRLGIQE